MKSGRKKQPHLFVALGVLMMLVGAYAMISCVIGGRLSSGASLPLPFGFTTVAVGAMLLTRTPIAVFFLFVYAVTILILGIIHDGLMSPLNVIWLVLLGLCLPLAKHAKK